MAIENATQVTRAVGFHETCGKDLFSVNAGCDTATAEMFCSIVINSLRLRTHDAVTEGGISEDESWLHTFLLETVSALRAAAASESPRSE